MKYLHTSSLCAAALALTAGAAMAADATPSSILEGPYVTIGGIYNTVSSSTPTINGAPGGVKFKDGWGVLGAGGYEWSNGLRGELEVSHRENNGDYAGTFGTNTPLLGKQRDTAAMANLAYDINTNTSITPYAGVGVGIDWVDFSQVHTATSSVFNGSNGKFAWQIFAGLGYAIDAKWKLVGEIRYLQSDDHNFSGTPAGSTVTKYNNRTTQFLLGLRYSFGEPAKVEAAAAPAPAPAPAPVRAPAPPVPQKFLVFFDFDKSNLRGDAQKIVSEAVEYAKTNGKATIVATGHTDTSGPDAYNMALSERRAKTVEKELERLGIPASEVVVHWKGESEPLVQTGDGVKEPQNRRVEIVLE
jgi:outer membrane protein OmpA-like peptidoglycan-associated protein